ncbi:surface protein with EGF domain and furin-like repeat protein, putative, partial (macronuclear) [Tetrahymena thermophila SB210]
MEDFHLNPIYSECIINKRGVENQSDLQEYKKFQKIYKFYLEIFGLISTQYTSSQMKVSLNGVEITKSLDACNGALCYSFKQQDLLNSYDLNLILYPLNSPSEKYQQYIQGTFLIVQLCSPYCDECDQDNVCSKCIEKYYLDSSGSCQPCDQTCLNCSGPSNENCLSCVSGLFFQQKSSSCVQNCDQNQYRDSQNVCQLCHQSCAICQGAGPNNCLSCQLGLYMQPITHSCVQTCDQNQYRDSQNVCQLCHQSCAICQGAGPNNCLSCQLGLYMQPITHSCVQTCDQNQYPDSQNICQLCDQSCAICQGAGPNNCLSCQLGLYMQLITHSCVQTCDQNQYPDSQNICQLCDQSCAICQGVGPNNCLSCQLGLYLQPITHSCVQTCDQNQYLDSQNICQLCDQSCATCQGAGPNNCLSCQLGLYMQPITHSCVQTCNQNQFINAQQQCQLCDQTCSSCDGAGPNSCLSCIPGLYYQPNKKQCVQNCDLNQFINSLNQCQPCDQSCASCDGSSSKSCLSCPQNSFLFNKMCVGICPNGFQSNLISLTCDQCQNYMDPKCNSCHPSCQLCKFSQAKDSQCNSCFSETRLLDSNNNCNCLNPKDQRNNFYQCSYQNIAVLDIQLSSTKPLLIIDFGSPLKGISVDTSFLICQQIFDQPTLILLGSDSLCQITGNQVQVNLGDSSIIMANNIVNFLPNKLQFEDYNMYFINTFYRNIVFQNDPGIPLLNFNYNPNENSCNPLSIALQNIQNDAGRKFLNINWTLVQVIGTMSDKQIQNIKKILQQASQDMATSINIDPKYIPSNQNIAIQFNYQLKVNKAGSQLFTINYQQSKYIKIIFQQSVYPPIYRYMSLSFYFQFYIEICELGLITYNNEPVDLQLISNQLQ